MGKSNGGCQGYLQLASSILRYKPHDNIKIIKEYFDPLMRDFMKTIKPLQNTPAAKRAKLADLMANGQGIKGFTWPESCGDFDFKITTNGVWHYKGSAIGRLKMCQLFATCLQRDDAGIYWLVTPVERGRVEVEDAPFVCLELESGIDACGVAWVRFRTNLDFWIDVDQNHPIRVELDENNIPRPYVHVRDGLWALISRSVFYHLVDLGKIKHCSDGREWMVIESNGQCFNLSPID